MASRAAWINVGGVDSVGAATITAPDLLTVVGHSLANGDLVAVDTITGGAVGPLEEGVTYFARDVSGDDFKLSGSRGGPIIQFPSAGTAAVYVAVPGYSAEELRQIASHGKFHGSANRLGARQGIRPGAGAPVNVAGTQWTVQTHTGTVEPAETSTQGPYDYVRLSTTGSLDPADGTNDRIDGIDLQILDDDADASGFRRSQVVYVAGTPGQPAPTVTPRSLRLATILVPSGGSPDPTVQTLAMYTVSSGGLLPVRNVSDRPTVGRYEGMYIDQADTDQLLRWNGSAWVQVSRPSSLRLPLTARSGTNLVGFSNTSPASGSPIVGVAFTAPPSGCIYLNTSASIRPDGADQTSIAGFVRTGSTVGSGTLIFNPAGGDDTTLGTYSVTASGTKGSIRVAVTGLTPGNSYNAHLMHWMAAGTGSIFWREIMIEFHD